MTRLWAWVLRATVGMFPCGACWHRRYHHGKSGCMCCYTSRSIEDYRAGKTCARAYRETWYPEPKTEPPGRLALAWRAWRMT